MNKQEMQQLVSNNIKYKTWHWAILKRKNYKLAWIYVIWLLVLKKIRIKPSQGSGPHIPLMRWQVTWWQRRPLLWWSMIRRPWLMRLACSCFKGKKPNSNLDEIPWFLPVYCIPHTHKIYVNNDSVTFWMSLIRG